MHGYRLRCDKLDGISQLDVEMDLVLVISCRLCRGAFDSAKNPQAPTPQAPVRNRQTSKVANAKVRIG